MEARLAKEAQDKAEKEARERREREEMEAKLRLEMEVRLYACKPYHGREESVGVVYISICY